VDADVRYNRRTMKDVIDDAQDCTFLKY